MGKYDPLVTYLAGLKHKRIRLTYRQIEVIIDGALPASAHRYQSWWRGSSASWLHEGWRAIPNLRKQRVDFVRDGLARRMLEDRLRPPSSSRIHKTPRQTRKRSHASRETGQWGGTNFSTVCRIEPARDRKGLILDKPHVRYKNERNLPLHAWGEGPFCSFRIPVLEPIHGVYIVAVNGIAKYVGETENLSIRFNTGYGSISPRNCFRGGQSTNCRINTLILKEVQSRHLVELWFTPSEDRKALEASLISLLAPPWNRR